MVRCDLFPIHSELRLEQYLYKFVTASRQFLDNTPFTNQFGGDTFSLCISVLVLCVCG
jgi:hypothetical protein